jgi:dihydroxy-acid dehydratase
MVIGQMRTNRDLAEALRAAPLARGYTRLYIDHVLQANRGAGLGFLAGASGHQPLRHNH